MKKVSLKLFLTVLGFCCITLGNPIKSNAVLQSNGGTNATKKIDDWILQIRQMEASGGTLGMNETINTTGLLSTTESNGLDCHMEKNTEYGAMVLLSASSYGNQSKIQDGGTTTGNASGVVMKLNLEWVAAGAGLTNTYYCKNANSRYINNDYGTVNGGKYHIGDAMQQGNWHGSGSSKWFAFPDDSGLVRSCSGSVFSYSGNSSMSGTSGDAIYFATRAGRAVIVIGEGL